MPVLISSASIDQKKAMDVRLLSLTFSICLVAAIFGKPLPGGGGKLAISNVAQILAFAFLFFRTPQFGLGQHLTFLAVTASSLMAACYTYLQYDVFGKPLVVFFVLVSLGFVFMVINLFEISEFRREDMTKAVQRAIYLAAVLYVFIIVEEFWAGDGISLGMDDKSHGSIYLGFLSFLSLNFLGREKFFFALYFLFLSLFSISRLSFVFGPFIFCMIFLLLMREGSLQTKMRASVLLVLLMSVAVWFIQDNPDYFKVLDRVSSVEEVSGSNSSAAHALLLKMGFDVKMHDPFLFVLGTSPGSFADILLRSGVNFSDLSILDPAFVSTAWQGRAPIHSTHMAIFVEYSIFIFMAYAAYILSLFWRTLRQREYLLIMFLIPYFISVLFYSAHNKFYFFVVIAIVEVTLRISKRSRNGAFENAGRPVDHLQAAGVVRT